MEEIRAAASPEEAARIGRAGQRSKPHLVTPDWETAKLFVMYEGLKAKVDIPVRNNCLRSFLALLDGPSE